MSTIWAILIGLVVGAFLGWMLCALLSAGGEREDVQRKRG